MLKKSLAILFCAILFATFFVGCDKDAGKTEKIKIEETNTASGLIILDLDYELNVPGNELPYSYLWDGTNTSVNARARSVEKRYNTYLTEYKESDGKYYLAYLKKDKIAEYKTWLKEYEDNNANDDGNYHFTAYDNEKVIDGKYFYCYQKLADFDASILKLETVDSLNDVRFEKNGYKLVLCATGKPAVIKQNVTTGESVNKNLFLFNRYELIFDDTATAPTYYSFTGREMYNQKLLKSMFDYVGEMLEAFPETYENMYFGCFPNLGLSSAKNTHRLEVLSVNGEKRVTLPRYALSADTRYDLLSDETTLPVTEEDVFSGHRGEFLTALIADTETENGAYIYSMYDYDKVAEIIKRK